VNSVVRGLSPIVRRSPFAACAVFLCAFAAYAQAPLPELTEPVNDFANVIDAADEQQLDKLIRTLNAATGDVVVVVTVKTVAPYADVREYAVKLFENHGRGIGERGKDNGLLVLLTLDERRVWIEVGYGLEQWITDGYAGETSRDYMAPAFRGGNYGAGLLAGVGRIVGRIAEGRNVKLTGVEIPEERAPVEPSIPFWLIVMIFLAIIFFSGRIGGPRRGVRRWGRGGWSGWSSGVGPFGGGGWTGGGGGFGGGFGGFGGGRSGGGGGGAGW
jgi:uncharacterized protein